MLPASSKRIGNTLRIDMSNDLSALDFIRSGQDPYYYSALSDGMTGDTSAWAYIGSFNSKTDDINHVYALKTYDPAALSAKLECMIRVYPTRDCRLLDGDRMLEYDGRPIDDGNLSSLGSIRMIDGGEELYSDQIRCCGSVSGGQRTLTLAYLVKQREGTLRNKAFPEQSVDVPAAQDGPAYEDGTTDEMNSYDSFECDVRMLNLRVTDSQMRPVSSPENFNLNADPSYIPLYPGREGALSSVSLSVADEYNIELLGPATPGMEEALARVNTDVDPYFDADTVKDSRLFGMVYEEFDEKAYDRSFRIYENPSINARSVLPERDGIYDMYVWRQSLAQYSENDLLRLRIALANTAALGKSPYLFAPLSAVPSVPVDVNYDPPTDSAETEINVGAGGRILASGTYDQISRSVQTCTNRLDGVRAVKVWIADGSFNVGFV